MFCANEKAQRPTHKRVAPANPPFASVHPQTSVYNAHFDASKTLLLLGAPVSIKDLMQYDDAVGDTRQLRADLQAWAADALTQHRTFHDTFLHGTSAHEGIALAALGGVAEVREQIAEFVGIVVGTELRHLRAVGPAIAAVDWAAHDQPW